MGNEAVAMMLPEFQEFRKRELEASITLKQKLQQLGCHRPSYQQERVPIPVCQ
jgi:hypothetical protein